MNNYVCFDKYVWERWPIDVNGLLGAVRSKNASSSFALCWPSPASEHAPAFAPAYSPPQPYSGLLYTESVTSLAEAIYLRFLDRSIPNRK